MKIKELAIWIGVIGILLAGLWGMVSLINNSSSPSNSPEPVAVENFPPVTDKDFVKTGSLTSTDSARLNNAKVTLVEYGDFECPACAAYYPFVKQLSADFPEDLRVVYRFFPLTNIHRKAMPAAQASYAAGLQGKFWEMHDLLYENQQDWVDGSHQEIFVEYAEGLDLDIDKFAQDLNNPSTKEFINKQRTDALAIGVGSTPTFILNNKRIQNPSNYEDFKKLIQDEIR